jgi:SAM-dependent methyltransferase
MHKSARDTGKLFFERYAPEPCTVIDIGALGVNGSLRSFAATGTDYIGVDFAEGEGVDVVLTDPYKLPFEDNTADVVVSSSCLEHSEFFWIVFLEMIRVLKPHGVLYVSAPSNGQFHRYPVDCWRFYPDSGRALQNWARRNGYDSLLLESFTGPQDWACWNDFVAVFVKDQAFANRYGKRISDTYHADNLLRSDQNEIINLREFPQDQRKLGSRLRRPFNTLMHKAMGL